MSRLILLFLVLGFSFQSQGQFDTSLACMKIERALELESSETFDFYSYDRFRDLFLRAEKLKTEYVQENQIRYLLHLCAWVEEATNNFQSDCLDDQNNELISDTFRNTCLGFHKS